MKTFYVIYDEKVAHGILEERCLTVHNCRTKHDAIAEYTKLGLKNTIFRSVKTPA